MDRAGIVIHSIEKMNIENLDKSKLTGTLSLASGGWFGLSRVPYIMAFLLPTQLYLNSLHFPSTTSNLTPSISQPLYPKPPLLTNPFHFLFSPFHSQPPSLLNQFHFQLNSLSQISTPSTPSSSQPLYPDSQSPSLPGVLHFQLNSLSQIPTPSTSSTSQPLYPNSHP